MQAAEVQAAEVGEVAGLQAAEVAGLLAEKMIESGNGSLSDGSCAEAVVPTAVLGWGRLNASGGLEEVVVVMEGLMVGLKAVVELKALVGLVAVHRRRRRRLGDSS